MLEALLVVQRRRGVTIRRASWRTTATGDGCNGRLLLVMRLLGMLLFVLLQLNVRYTFELYSCAKVDIGVLDLGSNVLGGGIVTSRHDEKSSTSAGELRNKASAKPTAPTARLVLLDNGV